MNSQLKGLSLYFCSSDCGSAGRADRLQGRALFPLPPPLGFCKDVSSPFKKLKGVVGSRHGGVAGQVLV